MIQIKSAKTVSTLSAKVREVAKEPIIHFLIFAVLGERFN